MEWERKKKGKKKKKKGDTRVCVRLLGRAIVVVFVLDEAEQDGVHPHPVEVGERLGDDVAQQPLKPQIGHSIGFCKHRLL